MLHGVDTGVRLDRLCALAGLVASVARFPIPPHKAVVGTRAFAHKLDAHVLGVTMGPAAYEAVPPETFGNDRHIGLGRLTGAAGVRARLAQLGLAVDDAAIVDALVGEVRALAAEQGAPIGDAQLVAMLERLRSAA